MPALAVHPTTFVSDREWRVQDLKQMPDGYRYEILNGVLYMAAMPFWPHPLVIENRQRTLGNWIWQHGLGHFFSPQTGIYYSDTQYVDPDLLFVRPEQTPDVEGVDEETWLREATLAIEVVSGSNTRAPRAEREALFHRVNVEEIWYADPKQKSLEVCARTDEGYRTVMVFREGDTVTSSLFPGFSIALSELWDKKVISG